MATRQELLRQINRLSDEVFGLYYAGFYAEAMAEAKHLRVIAREKLGAGDPAVEAIEENIAFMAGNRVDSRPIAEHRKEFQARKVRIFHIKQRIGATEVELSELEEPEKKSKARYSIAGLVVCFLALLVAGGAWYLHLQGPALSPDAVTVTGSSDRHRTLQGSAVFSMKPQSEGLLTVPALCQYPELPRGCEVTSLAMLLQYAGFNVDKMTLAEQVRKNPATMSIRGGNIYFGNPQRGFVGDMYSFSNPGLGVYADPITELGRKYLGNRMVNLSGRDIGDLYLFINNGLPVWVVTNTEFRQLPATYFATWNTEDGPIRITYKQHAVLITGYDGNSVYLNDPRQAIPNVQVDRKDFESAWAQMGRQAVSYLPKGLTDTEFMK